VVDYAAGGDDGADDEDFAVPDSDSDSGDEVIALLQVCRQAQRTHAWLGGTSGGDHCMLLCMSLHAS